MIRRATVRSLAKINLDLRVLHKRTDGYHELRTVFQTISLADSIEIEYEPARRTQLALDDPLAIPDNLVLRAAEAVLAAMRTHARVRFRLTKKIPMGGGLGGGSSNAAAVLLALPVLAGKRMELEALMDLGAQLGSDVPFFLVGGTALGIGRGTELFALPELRPQPLLLVCPGVHVSTAEAYRALGRGLTVTESSSKMNSFRAYVRLLGEVRSASAASSLSANDFEAAVFERNPQLRALPGRLKRLGATGAAMTGSGSAVFGLFDSRQQRNRAAEALRSDGQAVVSTELVSRRGYRALWRRQLQEHLRSPGTEWPPHSRYVRT
jgi:4-diphosphocytidyl-2-C-methyl-D-erythritol kinase